MASENELIHIHQNIEGLKNNIAVIKYILSEEGELTDEAKQRLKKSREISLSKYKQL